MHIAEGILPPVQCAVWFAASAPFVIHGAKKIIDEVKARPENKLLLAVAGAFTFVLSAIKLPSVTGSSSHPTGTGAGAVLFKPPVMAALGSIVLLFQALLLAHGGITTLGANILSFAVVGPWVGYGCWLLTKKLGGGNMLAIFLAMFFADMSTYVATSFQLAWALPDPENGFFGAVAGFLGVFALTQIPLAIMEGLLGMLLFRFLFNNAGEQMRSLGLLGKSADVATTAGTSNQGVAHV